MSSFRGSYDYVLDDKARVNIPARFRKAMNPEAHDTFVICRAPDSCLRAFPLDSWIRFEDEVASRPQTRATTDMRRALFSTARECTLDAQGRITLIAKQMELANIRKEVTLVGEGGFIEIWDRESYEKYVAAVDFDAVFYESVENTMNRK